MNTDRLVVGTALARLVAVGSTLGAVAAQSDGIASQDVWENNRLRVQ